MSEHFPGTIISFRKEVVHYVKQVLPQKDSVLFSRKSIVWFLPLLELSVRCKRPPHKQTAGRCEENESHPGGIYLGGTWETFPWKGVVADPKDKRALTTTWKGRACAKGGDTECKEQRGGSPHQRARLHGPCGLRVVGHSEKFCLCFASRGSPGSAVGRGEAGLDLHPGFYENES